MKETREFLFYCGMFHDAGKLYFLDTINLFARALFNEEFDLIRLHPQMAMSSSANGIPQNHTPRRRSTTISGTTKKAAIRASIPITATTTPFSTRSSPAADCLDAATDSVGRLITVEREQLYHEVFGKNVELVL